MAEYVAINKIKSEGKVCLKTRIKLLGTPRKAKNDWKYVKGVFADSTGCLPFTVFNARLLKTLDDAYLKKQTLRIKGAVCKMELHWRLRSHAKHGFSNTIDR